MAVKGDIDYIDFRRSEKPVNLKHTITVIRTHSPDFTGRPREIAEY